MDSFRVDKLKLQKARAMLRYRRLLIIASLFRFVELCMFLIFIFWFSTHLLITFRNSGKYFKDLSGVFFSSRFVFVIGNAIVITLLAKSSKSSSPDCAGFDLYDEFVKKSERKQSLCEENTFDAQKHCAAETKVIQRSKSESLKRERCDKASHQLRRSETEKCRNSVYTYENPARTSYAADNMSNEEFKKTVEAFIARQQRLRREEESFFVLL